LLLSSAFFALMKNAHKNTIKRNKIRRNPNPLNFNFPSFDERFKKVILLYIFYETMKSKRICIIIEDGKSKNQINQKMFSILFFEIILHSSENKLII